MTHRQIMEALSGLLLGMFVAILSSTIVSNALPDDHHRPATARQSRVHLGGHRRRCSRSTATTPIWGKLADLFSKKLLVQLALVIYVARLGAWPASRRTPAMLIACRVRPGHRRRRPVRAGPDRDGGDDLAARARPLQRLPRRARSPSPPSAARCSAASSSTPAGSAGAGASTSACRSPSSRWSCSRRPCTCRSSSAKVQDRLAGRDLDHRGRLAAADLGHPRRRQVRLGLLADRRDGRRRASLLGALFVARRDRASRADRPAAAVPQPDDHPRRRRQRSSSASRCSARTVFLGQYFQIARG